MFKVNVLNDIGTVYNDISTIRKPKIGISFCVLDAKTVRITITAVFEPSFEEDMRTDFIKGFMTLFKQRLEKRDDVNSVDASMDGNAMIFLIHIK